MCAIQTEYILRPNKPASKIPMIRRVRPRANWVPFPTRGRNGLLDAPSQSCMSDESICYMYFGVFDWFYMVLVFGKMSDFLFYFNGGDDEFGGLLKWCQDWGVRDHAKTRGKVLVGFIINNHQPPHPNITSHHWWSFCMRAQMHQ